MTTGNVEFPVPTHTTISTYHLARLKDRIEFLEHEVRSGDDEVDELIRQRDEARAWAARFYRGWETNDDILPDWIRDKEVPHGVSD